MKSVQDLVGYAKHNPDKLLFASAGSGSSIHVEGELFKPITGTRMTHVPFKAVAVAITDIVAGRVHLIFDNINSVGPHVKAGRLRGLAVTSAKRVPAFSELPTMAEAGLAGFEVTAWAGVIVPRGVPRERTDRLNKEVNAALSTAAVRDKLALQGLEIVGGTAEQFTAHIAKEAAKWADVVKRAGVKVD